jgi:hypothetical protein
VSTDDLVVVLLIGHGSVDEGESKFNLVGPDLSASEWAGLLKPLKARLVFVDTTGGSFPFLRRLAGPGRIVITATDSDAQQFETVFPEFFVRSFDEPSRTPTRTAGSRFGRPSASPVPRSVGPSISVASFPRNAPCSMTTVMVLGGRHRTQERTGL